MLNVMLQLTVGMQKKVGLPVSTELRIVHKVEKKLEVKIFLKCTGCNL